MPLPINKQPKIDIAGLEANSIGNDYVIGDIHGELDLLQDFVDTVLEPGDRLFLVGDLTDRGQDSLGVLKFLQEHNASTKKIFGEQQIYSIRGNHEDTLIRYIRARLDPNYDKAAFKALEASYERNGGEWAFKLSNETLAAQLNYLESLPYIMRVENVQPFNLVHADMPFPDQELRRRLDQNQVTLSDKEKRYATWARLHDKQLAITPNGRTHDSDPTYCGHTPLGGIRLDTMHVNLDAGSFSTRHLCVVNHTMGQCEIFRKGGYLSQATQGELQRLSVEEKLVVHELREVQNKINATINFRIGPLTMLNNMLDEVKGHEIKRPPTPLFAPPPGKFSKHGFFTPQHEKSMQDRNIHLLNDAILRVNQARSPAEVQHALLNYLVNNIKMVKTHSKNKNDFGDSHTEILAKYPQLVEPVLQKYNLETLGKKIRREDVLPADKPKQQVTLPRLKF